MKRIYKGGAMAYESCPSRPSSVTSDGAHEWNLNSRHRDDGPSFIQPTGTMAWWIYGRRHRIDGPAVIGAGGQAAWYEDNIHLRWTRDYPHGEILKGTQRDSILDNETHPAS